MKKQTEVIINHEYGLITSGKPFWVELLQPEKLFSPHTLSRGAV